jgi:hypothetical protein
MFSYTQVPGLSANVTVPAGGPSQVLIETDGGVQINATDALASCFIDVALFVDGAQVGPSRRVTVLNNPVVIYSVSTYGFSTQTSLTSGAVPVAATTVGVPAPGPGGPAGPVGPSGPRHPAVAVNVRPATTRRRCADQCCVIKNLVNG